MAKRMRRNGGQWMVLLAGRESDSQYVWFNSSHRDDCYVTSTHSFDEAVMAAFALMEGELFRTAYLIDPRGIPCAVVTVGETSMVLTKLGTPLRSEFELPAGAVVDCVQEAHQYTYVRSRGGWITDGPEEVTPMVSNTWVGQRTRFAEQLCMWPGAYVMLRITPYDKPYDPRPRWQSLDAAAFASMWRDRTIGLFSTPYEEAV